MKKTYSPYSIEVIVGQFYWLRRQIDPNLKLVRVISIDKSYITVTQENNQKIIVSKNELLDFDPTNKLFKCLMNNAVYRHDNYIRKILQIQGKNPESYMMKIKEEKDTTDFDIEESVFYKEYRLYARSEESYCDEMMLHVEDIIVTGTLDLNIYLLYKKVCENGGMERITNDQKWKSLFYSTMSKTNVSYTIRTCYKKYLYEFELIRRSKDDYNDYNYIFNIRDNISINVDNQIYYGTVKLRRNRAINQYYIQFYMWSRENSEWFSEDKIKLHSGLFQLNNYIKRKTRSSKANNLIDDPLTREKHSHLSHKSAKRKYKKCNENERKYNSLDHSKNNQTSLGNPLSYKDLGLKEGSLTNRFFNEQVTEIESVKQKYDAFINDELMKSNRSSKQCIIKPNTFNGLLARNPGKRKQRIIKLLQKTNILDKNGTMSEDNYMFLSFFNLN